MDIAWKKEDLEFLDTLQAHLQKVSGDDLGGIPASLFLNPDGSVNREKTLAMDCYAGFKG